MTRDATNVEIIAGRLHEAGVRHAFGIPGGEVLSMLDAFERAGIRFVLTKHENCAGFMAEGVYQRTGAPGVLVSTLGPGVTNAVTTVANAWQDRVPLIYLTGCVDASESLTYNHQILDHQALLRPVVKASFRLDSRGADSLIEKALAIATADRPGPVHIDLPMSLAATPARLDGAPRHAAPSPTAPCGPALEQAREWLRGAERPLVVAGLDVLVHEAGASLNRFCEAIGAPVVTTYKAKGVVPEDARHCLGGAGLSPLADRHLGPVVKAADVVVLAGYDPIEMRTGWRNLWDPREQHVIEVSAASNDHFMHQAGVSFVCDVGAGLDALAEGVEQRATWTGGEPARCREALAGAFGQNESWGPAAVVTTVRAALGRDAVATVDSGAHRILQSQVWESYQARTLLQSSALCTMGGALGLAMGAKLADREREVVCFTGDAGLEMVLGDLSTLRDLDLAVIVVVFVDASLALIELKQRGMSLDNVGVDFGRTDFAALGRAYGGTGVSVDSREALAAALEAARDAETFTLIACEIDARAYDGRI